jgi:hypothetical protein
MIALTRELYGYDIPIRGHCTGKQKADPLEGLPGLSVEIENDVFTYPLQEVKEWKDQIPSAEVAKIVLIRELLEYPLGLSTDVVMALWFANLACKYGMKFAQPGVYSGGKGTGRRMYGGGPRMFGGGYTPQEKKF